MNLDLEVFDNEYNEKDTVTYNNDQSVDYYDPENKRYKIFAAKNGSKIFKNVAFWDIFDSKWADIGKVFCLIEHMDQDNRICFYNRSGRRLRSVTSEKDFCDMLNVTKKTWTTFYKKLQKYSIIREIIIKGINGAQDTKQYYINPIYTMGSKWITLSCYKLFQDELDKVLPARAINDLQRHWREEFFDTEEQTLKEKPAMVETINVEEKKATMIEEQTLTKKEKNKIFFEYIFKSTLPQMYQLNKGMYGVTRQTVDINKDIWFTPNTTDNFTNGRKKAASKEISHFNAWYIDIDAGKDENGNYFPLEEVARRKVRMRNILGLLPNPTAIVDTRNGYHIYWACYDVTSLDEWQQVENSLINIVSIADSHARDVSRLLRVPNSLHLKDPKNPYRITIAAANRIEYPAADMIFLLNKAAADIKSACDSYIKLYGSERKTNSSKKTAPKRNSGTVVKLTNNAAVEKVRRLIAPTYTEPPTAVPSNEIIRYIRATVRLTELLNIPPRTAFRCIFDDHDDIHPSAYIYNNEDHDRYICSCTRRGLDVIDVVQRLAHCSTHEAISYLSKVANVTQAQQLHA